MVPVGDHVMRTIKASMSLCSLWGNSRTCRNAALLISGLLALSAAALSLLPAREVEVYGHFSPHDLSQITHVALRHIRVAAFGNLRRSILKPTLLTVALRD